MRERVCGVWVGGCMQRDGTNSLAANSGLKRARSPERRFGRVKRTCRMFLSSSLPSSRFQTAGFAFVFVTRTCSRVHEHKVLFATMHYVGLS